MQTKSYLYPLLGISLLFCLAGNFKNDYIKKLLQELQLYTEQKVIPTLQIQRLKLNRYLSPQDHQRIQILQIRKNKILKQKEIFLKKTAKPADNQMDMWENIQKEQNEINQQTYEIADDYENVLKNLFSEIAQSMFVWRLEMNQIVEKYNQYLNENEIRKFKKHGLGELTQMENFILWNPENQEIVSEESQADDGSQFFSLTHKKP